MPSERDVSVIIPAYNAEKYLSCAIGSVLAQTWKASEVIVVDDGSTDNTAAIAAGFRDVRLIRNTHSGAAATRNLGVRQATGRYLAFLDADDLWLPDKLDRQLVHLAHTPKAKAVFGKIRQFVSPELPESERSRYQCSPDPAPGTHSGCLLIERAVFLRVGLFTETLPAGEFIEWMIRARRQDLEFPMLEDVVMLRRIHGGNITLTDKTSLHRSYLQIIRQKTGGQAR